MTTGATLKGTIFLDRNADGQEDQADAGLPGEVVNLFSADGRTLVATTNTQAGGTYSFTNLAPGTYNVQVVVPGGYRISPAAAGSGHPGSTVSSDGTQVVSLGAGGTGTVNAGFYAPVSVSGVVFTDSNDDGLVDGDETTRPGVTVQLLNAQGAVVANTTSASDGSYAFTGLIPGTYSVHFVAPAGSSWPKAAGNTAPLPYTPGATITDSNNLLQNGSFEQFAGTGKGQAATFSGWTGSTNGASTPFGSGPGFGPEIIATNNTTINAYTGRVPADNANPNDAGGPGNYAAFFVDDDAVETLSQTITLKAGQVYEVGFDLYEDSQGAGNRGWFTVSASIGGRTILAADSRNSAGLTVNNWTHFAGLYTPASTGPVQLTFTYASATPGSSLACKDVLLDEAYVVPGQATQTLTPSSQVDASGNTAPVTLNSGQTVGNVSAGLSPPSATIQGVVFSDFNDNGVFDRSDKGLAGQTVTLSLGGVVVGSAVTNASGQYGFANQSAGTYSVEFTAPGGEVFSPAGGSSGGTNSTVGSGGTQSVTVGSSGGTYAANAGLYTTPAISGVPASQSSTDNTTIKPFSAASVTLPNAAAASTASIILSSNGVATDANGLLSGSGLVKTGTGTYTLAASTPAALSTALKALVFTPTAHEVSAGHTVPTSMALTATQGSASTSTVTTVTETATCFLAGTRILAERGEVAVEALAVGERVAVLVEGAITYKPVRWIGGRHLDAAAVRRSFIHPVRIRAGAFADGVPHRDLLVTPEHCIFVENRLVPARMLVNGRSIVEDRTLASFSFYHVELDAHGVLLAEGLGTESYLDTGNRNSFANAEVPALQPVLSLDAGHKSWAEHAAAPLATDRDTVEPIWARLERRAVQCGMADQRRPVALSDDPQLRVVLDSGELVTARWGGGARHFFQIPPGTRPVRLLSRVATPAEVVGPFVDDRRRLGVQVRRIVLWSGLRELGIEAGELALSGWHAPENGLRWTNGDAELDLPAASTTDTFLELHLSASLAYSDNSTIADAA